MDHHATSGKAPSGRSVGFLGAFRNPGGIDPVLAGSIGAAVTVRATFAPCFLWIFLGTPFIEHLRGNELLGGALSAITAAVAGLIYRLTIPAPRTAFDAGMKWV